MNHLWLAAIRSFFVIRLSVRQTAGEAMIRFLFIAALRFDALHKLHSSRRWNLFWYQLSYLCCYMRHDLRGCKFNKNTIHPYFFDQVADKSTGSRNINPNGAAIVLVCICTSAYLWQMQLRQSTKSFSKQIHDGSTGLCNKFQFPLGDPIHRVIKILGPVLSLVFIVAGSLRLSFRLSFCPDLLSARSPASFR